MREGKGSRTTYALGQIRSGGCGGFGSKIGGCGGASSNDIFSNDTELSTITITITITNDFSLVVAAAVVVAISLDSIES